MSLLYFFAQHPVFTRESLVRHLAMNSGEKPKESTVSALLRYHQGVGHILSVRRGLFASVAPGGSPTSAPADAYLLGALGCPGGVLGYHSALELHGLAYSSFEKVQILVSRSQREWTFRGVTYQPVKPRRSLNAEALTLEVESMDRLGLDLPVTSVARTLVDVLDRPDLSGGWEEVWRSLETIRLVDLHAVLTYLERLGNATTAALVGFFLEQHQTALSVDEAMLESLEKQRPRGKHYLDRSKGGRLASRWNLIVPDALWGRAWEEMR